MSITIANRRFSLTTAQERLRRAVGVVMPNIVRRNDAAAKVRRLKSLAQGLGLVEPVNIIDVGANPLGYDAPYQPLLDAGLCKVIGFEPQGAALEELNAKKSEAETYFINAVGDGELHDLQVYKYDGLTSLFPLDPKSTALLPPFAAAETMGHTEKMKTVRLDDFEGIDDIDFLKIDIQGGELLVMQNARKKLAHALAVQIELRFLPLYIGEPRFGEVDLELARHNFEIHTAVPLEPLPVSTSQHNNFKFSAGRQILDGDFMYVRQLRELQKLPTEKLKKLAVLADGAFDSVQLTLHCIDILAALGEVPNDLAKSYFKSLPARYRR